jgi:predicted nucleic acid-binding protein
MWLFDANILSEMIRKKPDVQVRRRMIQVATEESYSSVICCYELRYGETVP